VDRTHIIREVCALALSGKLDAARKQLSISYPVAIQSTSRGRWSQPSLLNIFLRDRFTDRYSGARLIFPGALRMLSLLMPAEFPYQRNWRQSETHPAFWELSPTIDHVVPIARGGPDHESNIVTTSMLRNAAKANWLLEELEWSLKPAPIAGEWDGMIGWFLAQWQADKRLQTNSALRQWHRAAIACALARRGGEHVQDN